MHAAQRTSSFILSLQGPLVTHNNEALNRLLFIRLCFRQMGLSQIYFVGLD